MLVFLLLSCVSKGTHELVEVQLDATRTALSAKNASCYEEVRDRDVRLTARGEALSVLQAEHAALVQRHEQAQAELLQVRAELAETISPEMSQRVQLALGALSEQELTAASEQSHLDTWKDRLSALEAQGRLTVTQRGADVVVAIPTVQVFNEGRVSVSPRGEVLLVALSEAMAETTGDRLEVVAHTDNAPYHSAAHASNWELGFAQAMTLVRSLQPEGDGRIVASSAAGTMPLVEGDDEESRKQNRRLEIIIRP